MPMGGDKLSDETVADLVQAHRYLDPGAPWQVCQAPIALERSSGRNAAWRMARRYVGENPTTVVAPTFWTLPRIKFSVKA